MQDHQQEEDAQLVNGARVGEYVESELFGGGPRELLTGIDAHGTVKLSDDRDGVGMFTGYYVGAEMVGVTPQRTFVRCDPQPVKGEA